MWRSGHQGEQAHQCTTEYVVPRPAPTEHLERGRVQQLARSGPGGAVGAALCNLRDLRGTTIAPSETVSRRLLARNISSDVCLAVPFYALFNYAVK